MTEAMKNVFSCPLDIGYMIRNAPPALDHVLPGLLAETVGLVVGPGAVSKTMLALQMVLRWQPARHCWADWSVVSRDEHKSRSALFWYSPRKPPMSSGNACTPS